MAATTITTSVPDQSLLQLLQLTSPSLPIGGFSWSQGLEYAIDSGWLKNEADTAEWLAGVILQSLAGLDVPVLVRLMDSVYEQDFERLCQWNRFLLASRETNELHLEDTQMGNALKRLLLDLEFFTELDFPPGELSYLCAYAMAAAYHRIDVRSACIGFLWSWLENQIAAALKSFPLGQTAGQRLFHQLSDAVMQAVEYGMTLRDDQLGNGMPGQIMASMLHEEQYSRLFRS